MDFKGVTWAGNLYHKFEAMCLEVEEVMYEDTVKYVENQAQKVGVSVKKFYSEVMRDLLPPSCVDPVKVAVGDLSSIPYSRIELNRPRPITSEEQLKKNETKHHDISDLAEDDSSSRVCNDVKRISPPSSRVLVESDVGPTKSKKVGVRKRPIGIKRISRSDRPSNVSRDFTRRLAGDLRSSISSSLVGSDDMSVTTSSELLVRCRPREEVNVDTRVSDKIISDESVMQDMLDHEYAPCDSEEKVLAESPRPKEDGSRCTLSDHGSTGSHFEGNFDMEIIYNEEAVEPRVAILETFENSNLDGTCILVEGDKLHFVSPRTKKHKSYKEKIREALSSKLRSAKKRDECASHDKVVQGMNNPAESDKRSNSPFHDSSESDWELL